MSKDRLAHLRAAKFRHTAKQNGGSFCKHCGGLTATPAYDFCLRHWRMLPSMFKKHSLEDQLEYLKLREAVQVTWRTDGVTFVVASFVMYQTAREGVAGVVVKDKESGVEVNFASSIKQLREWLLSRVGECSNLYAAKTKIR